jgi:tetratricopeptide (TPR) repeat protein
MSAKANPQPDNTPEPRLVTAPEEQAKARKWFVRARELGDKRQWDYAIEYYVNGLEFWPDAVEEALKPLHGCSIGRRNSGGSKPGLGDTLKRSMTDKNPRQAYVNSLWLFGHEPDNLNYLEGVVKNAVRLGAADAALWAGGVCHKAMENSPKVSVKQLTAITQYLTEIGDRTAHSGDSDLALALYNLGIEVYNLWRRRYARDQNVDKMLRELSTRMTILRGKYKDGSYRDSIVDAVGQSELHDLDRSQQSDERLDQLIAKAREAYEANPADPAILKDYVEILRRRERTEEETAAIGVLVEAFKSSGEYRWKQIADDIRMKQLGRESRAAAKTGDREAVAEQRVKQLRFELTAFKERVARYPTDNRMKFEYALRLFQAGRYDDAIPLFQAARVDPKNRAACGCYLGRCFLKKGFYGQAVETFNEAMEAHEFEDDDLAKDLRYYLARAYEESGEVETARQVYGQILKFDYNYRDVRARLEGLPPSQGSGGG